MSNTNMVVKFSKSEDLVEQMMDFKGSSACSLEMTTKLPLAVKSRTNHDIKRDIFKGDVYKTYTECGNIGISYENAVNNQRKREEITEEFKAESLWKGKGRWIKPNVIMFHEEKQEYYLRMYSGMNANGLTEVIYHYEDGSELSEAEIALLPDFLPLKGKSKSQGVEKEVKPKALKINGINKLVLGGKTYLRK